MSDVATTLLGLGLLALSILPFIHFYIYQKNKTKKFLTSYFSAAKQQQLNIDVQDVWSEFAAIGLDTATNNLFYFKKTDRDEQQALISLAEVAQCTVNTVKGLRNTEQVIERLELVFSFRPAGLPPKTIIFYNRGEAMTLSAELQLVEKWKTLVQTQLNSKKTLAMAV